ncbi:MAG: Eco57I restriction-modification methylase domain-containing protein, partial [Fusobacteriaceae bacterium]
MKYDVVITNPPYMGSKGYSDILKKYIEKNYKDSKADLFAVFMEKDKEYCKSSGYLSMVTMNSWMFLSSYEELRKNIIKEQQFISILHLGMEAFESIVGKVVQTVAWVTKNKIPNPNFKMEAVRLVDYYDSRRWEKEQQFFNSENRYQSNQKDFKKIPGSPIAYWVSERIKEIFTNSQNLELIGKASEGIKTGNNDKYLRQWHEISKKEFYQKWFPHHKGGEFKKWYGNNEYVIEWENNGKKIKSEPNSGLQGKEMYLKKILSWSKITSTSFSCRFISEQLFDSGSPAYFCNNQNNFNYIISFLNSNLNRYILGLSNPTLNYQVGNIKNVPIIFPELEVEKNKINQITENCIEISKIEWDSRETSWDFEGLELVQGDSLESSYVKYCESWREKFFTMHKNEEE